VYIFHDVLSRGLQVGEERYPVRNSLEVVEGEFEADRVSDGDQMEYSIGRTSENHSEDLLSETA